MIVITAGTKYIDIDTYACGIAYQQLLTIQGKDATTVFAGPLNQSVAKTIQSWDVDYLLTPPSDTGSYVIVDLSDPEHIAPFVDQDKIVKIFDHHFGYEQYWQDRLGDNSIIESIGSCATLIWREYTSTGLSQHISTTSANLLYTAIISNTLNFNASVTTKEDIKSAKQLQTYCSLPDNWTAIYFNEQEATLFDDVVNTVTNDTKIIRLKGTATTLAIGQVELWDSREFVENHQIEITDALTSNNLPLWLLTSPSISEGISYLYTENDNVKKILSDAIDVTFDGNIGTTDKLWLRKEIIRELQQL